MTGRPGVPRRFWLIEESNTETKIVAEGTQSSQGPVVVFPPDSDTPTRIWPDMDALLATEPQAKVHWLDADRLLRRCIP